MTLELASPSTDHTLEIAKSLGEVLKGDELILLSGELGAGKTLFTKGIARGLGIDPAEVVSPTFTVMNQYRPAGREGNAYPKLIHFDLYRWGENLDPHDSVPEIDEYLEEAIIVVEWAQYLGPAYFLLKNVVDIGLAFVPGENKRLIRVQTGLDYLTIKSSGHPG